MHLIYSFNLEYGLPRILFSPKISSLQMSTLGVCVLEYFFNKTEEFHNITSALGEKAQGVKAGVFKTEGVQQKKKQQIKIARLTKVGVNDEKL